MNISGCSFNELSYSKLFTTYLNNFKKLQPFYPYNPQDSDDIAKRADELTGGIYKKPYLQALSHYHQMLGIADSQKPVLDKLAQDGALTIVTGQQLGVYGGPVFTIYKTITAILLAKKYEAQLGKPVIPVFWMADEDHDFEEIAWAGIPDRDDYHKILFEEEGSGDAVATQKVNGHITGFKEKVKEHLFDTDFSDDLWAQIDRCYQPDKTHAQAFAQLINTWFKDTGLLIAGSNTPGIKKLLGSEFKQSISASGEIYEAIEQQSKQLEQQFHRQVMNGDSNLFYDENGIRQKIHAENGKWTAGQQTWSEKELLAAIENHPENFSPNVFLRPVVQDKLLPVLGYVAGPGEIAYYGQMKQLYQEFELEMPVIFPRYTATLIESGISRIVDKLPFKFCEYNKRIEDLESDYVDRTESVDLEKLFGDWKQKLEASAEEPLKVINDIDPTLEGTVGKTVAGFSNELDKLKGKVYRSIKKQDEIQLKRIEKIKVNLFPDSGLQERAVSPVYFMNKYGLDLWQKLMQKLEEEGLDLSRHHLIEL